MRPRQTKRSPHAQEERTPTPAVNLKSTSTSSPRAWKERERLSVGKDVQQPKQFTVDACGRGNDRRQEGLTQPVGLVTPTCCDVNKAASVYFAPFPTLATIPAKKRPHAEDSGCRQRRSRRRRRPAAPSSPRPYTCELLPILLAASSANLTAISDQFSHKLPRRCPRPFTRT